MEEGNGRRGLRGRRGEGKEEGQGGGILGRQRMSCYLIFCPPPLSRPVSMPTSQGWQESRCPGQSRPQQLPLHRHGLTRGHRSPQRRRKSKGNKGHFLYIDYFC